MTTSRAIITAVAVLATLTLGGVVRAADGDRAAPEPLPSDLPSAPSAMELGMYSGPFQSSVYRAIVGREPGVETTYVDAARTSSPDIAAHEAEISRGISPVITLDDKSGPFTRAEIAAWGVDVQRYFATFVAGLRTLSDDAAAADNGTRVYFADEHEAQVKIDQHKYDFAGYGAAGGPTTADSAAAWNRVMGYVSQAAPAVVRVYWYSGAGRDEDAFAADLDPQLIQMATIDPYRWAHDAATDTPAELWGAMIDHLKSQPWMRRADGSLKPWGVTEWGTDVSLGDGANAVFVAQAIRFFEDEGAAFAVYFNRVDHNDVSNDFLLTDGRQPRAAAAFSAAAP